VTDADIVTIDQRIQRAGAANCWTGTLGSLAGDARRLVRHIQETRRMAEEYPPRIEVQCNTCRGIVGLVPTCPDCNAVGKVWKRNSPAEPWKYANENPPCFRPGFERDRYERRASATRAAAIAEHSRLANEQLSYPVDHILRGERELKHYPGDEMEPEATLIEEPEGPPVAVQLLDTARAAVLDRHRVYGPPQEHFARTVGMVNSLFASVLKRPLTTSDWARIMLLDKLARDLGPRPHPDNAVDLAGYAACLAECQASAPPADRAT
jgi:hypothetical protein